VVHDEHHRIELHAIPAPRGVPLRTISLDRRQKVEVESVSDRLSRLPNVLHIEGVEDGDQPTQMIGVPVREHDRRQIGHATSPKKRDHNASTCVTAGTPRPAIDQHPPAARRPDGGCVSLTDR
jgi:hypothetical protein